MRTATDMLLICVLGGLGACAPRTAAAAPALEFPLACAIGVNCEIQHYVDIDAGPGVRDYRGGRRSYDGHSGVDIRIADMAAQRRGVDVLAAAAGRVARLRDGVADVSIRAEGAPKSSGQECGNGVVIDHGGGWESQYCHLAMGSLRVGVGETVAAGQRVAQVGLSGATEFAHLHLTIRRAGVVVDPFSSKPGAAPLWSPNALKALGYKEGAVLNAGFAGGPVSMDAVESGTVRPPATDPPVLVAYVRAIELEGSDDVELRLIGPDGTVLAQSRKTLERDKAQYLVFVGKRRPALGWSRGNYRAEFAVRRRGKVALSRRFDVPL